MTLGPIITIWTIRVAIALYGAATASLLLADGRSAWRMAARWLWTAGCGIYVIHVLVAFHVYHHWSHTAVLEHTARRVGEVIGTPFGEGVYVSYLFTILWVVDCADWWRAGLERYAARPRWLTCLLHGFFAFIVFNGTVVFEQGPIRWFGGGLFAVLAVLLAWRLARTKGREIPAVSA